MVAEPARDEAARPVVAAVAARLTRDPRAARARPGAKAPHEPRRRRAPTSFKTRLEGLRAAEPSFIGARAFATTTSPRLVPVHRLDAVLLDLGARGPLSRRSSSDTVVGEAARDALRRRAGDADAGSSRRSWLTARGVVGFWPANARWRRHRALRGRRPRRAALARSTPCASRWRGQRQARTLRLADFVAPVGGVADYIGGFAVTAGHRRGGVAERFEAADDDYSADHGQGAGRPAGRGLRRAAARAGPRANSGATRQTSRSTPDELIARELSRHPPGARLSGPARPHREGDAVPPAGRGARNRHHADRSFAMTPACLGFRALSRPSRGHYFGVGKIERDQVRGLRPPQGLGRWRTAERWLAPILAYDPKPRAPNGQYQSSERSIDNRRDR